MVNWYYVVGADRVGPVSVEALKHLFLKREINPETYIWKKGFANWERLKDVTELKFDEEVSVVSAPAPVTPTAPIAPVAPQAVKVAPKEVEKSSPEISFSFTWNKVKENEDLFFIKTGKDRKGGADIYGPYSLVELKEALTEKRINLQTLLFSPGMNSWTKIQETPLNENFRGSQASSVSLNEVPLVILFEHSPMPIATVVKKAGTKDGVLLGSGPFGSLENKTVKVSLYVGSEIKVKNVQLQIQKYDKRDQSIECQFIDLSQDAKRIMLNHAV